MTCIRHNSGTRRVSSTLWHAEQEAPAFVVPRRFRSGRYTLQFRGQTVGDVSPTSMKVYYADAAGQFSPTQAVVLGRLPREGESDEVRVSFDLPCDTPALRFDPAESPCRFHLTDLRFKRRSLFNRAWNAARAVASHFRSPVGLLADIEKFLGKKALSADEQAESKLPLVVPDDLPQFPPLNLRTNDKLAPRLNVLIPGLALSKLSGGPNTAINLAYRLAERGLPIRYFSMDIPMESDRELLWNHFQTLTGIDRRLPNVELVNAHDRGIPVEVGHEDIFLATAWWTAQVAKRALPRMKNKRFLYLIQDFEPGLYAWSTSAALAHETYELDYRGIVCGSLLGEYLAKYEVGRFASPEFQKRCLTFEPAVDLSKFYMEQQPRSGKKRLLFYARPRASRNLYELGLVALKRAVDRGAFPASDWELWFMGDNLPPADLGNGVQVRQYPWSNYDDYARLLRTADVGLSLMLSPHTSYPPLEMAACGAVVVTNTFSVKTAETLRNVSGNLLPVSADLDGVVQGLMEASLRSNDLPSRRLNSRVNVPAQWDDVFDPLIPQVLNMWNDCLSAH